jgi:hypothetical protein
VFFCEESFFIPRSKLFSSGKQFRISFQIQWTIFAFNSFKLIIVLEINRNFYFNRSSKGIWFESNLFFERFYGWMIRQQNYFEYFCWLAWDSANWEKSKYGLFRGNNCDFYYSNLVSPISKRKTISFEAVQNKKIICLRTVEDRSQT